MGNINFSETKLLKIKEPITLKSGKTINSLEIAYETYGKLNENKDNAILVLHALTGSAHAAYIHKDTNKAGWWDDMIGKDKAFDTDKYFIISSNVLGGCYGTTGPSSINPETGKPYALDFPVITVEDMVDVQKKLIDYLGIEKLIVAGGSMGGMQAIEWSIRYPQMVKSTILIATSARLNAQGIAFNAVARNAILTDSNFNNGNYYDKENPSSGLSIARMIGHITYLCEEAMFKKFGREFKDGPSFDFGIDFQVESYLAHQGKIFVDRFDANSYLYITKAVDYYDPIKEHGSLEEAFKKTNSRFLIISFSSDWLFTTSQSKQMVNSLVSVDKDVSFVELESKCGHDAFLLEFEKQTKIIKSFLRG
ncbi:MAG: homoserine O-acetyltransferase [Ruminococcaceae bacterium]|nr:homoserine O-acetyltransferase [Oscillospiraceae bacterium]